MPFRKVPRVSPSTPAASSRLICWALVVVFVLCVLVSACFGINELPIIFHSVLASLFTFAGIHSSRLISSDLHISLMNNTTFSGVYSWHFFSSASWQLRIVPTWLVSILLLYLYVCLLHISDRLLGSRRMVLRVHHLLLAEMSRQDRDFACLFAVVLLTAYPFLPLLQLFKWPYSRFCDLKVDFFLVSPLRVRR